MEWYYVQTEADDGEARNAGAKAPADVSAILAQAGFTRLGLRDVERRDVGGALAKLKGHRVAKNRWLEAVSSLKKGDGVVMQVPFACHTIWFGKVVTALRKKDIRLILLVHDLESVRLGLTGDVSFAQAQRFKLEESAVFSYAQAIIVHNDHMADFVAEHLGYSRERIVSLRLFDYLVPDAPMGVPVYQAASVGFRKVIVAGNLRRDKAGYLYDIPDDVDFEYFGDGYEPNESRPRVTYRGSFPADELPSKLDGGFGLVWDGPQGTTCSGVYGTYLTINNPHKTSLYLASGLPVVTWSKAAIADVIRDEGVGLCVESLYDLHDALAGVTEEAYVVMVNNARKVGERLRAGAFTLEAVHKACEIAQTSFST